MLEMQGCPQRSFIVVATELHKKRLEPFQIQFADLLIKGELNNHHSSNATQGTKMCVP